MKTFWLPLSSSKTICFNFKSDDSIGGSGFSLKINTRYNGCKYGSNWVNPLPLEGSLGKDAEEEKALAEIEEEDLVKGGQIVNDEMAAKHSFLLWRIVVRLRETQRTRKRQFCLGFEASWHADKSSRFGQETSVPRDPSENERKG